MAIQVKDWKNAPDSSTPISAEALEDLETRMGAYTDKLLNNYGKGFIAHGSNASTARPVGFVSIDWFGSVQPSNWDPTKDSWRTTAAIGSGGGGGGSSGQEVIDLGSVSGTVVIDMSGKVNSLFRCRATATTTFSVSNLANGAWCELRVTQPTATSAAITWPTGLWAGGQGMTHTPVANAVDRVAYQGNPSGTPDAFIVGNNFRTPL